MNDNLNKFLGLASSNEELRYKIDEINKKYPEPEKNCKALIELVKEYSITLTENDLLKNTAEEMSEEELEQVSGGRIKAVTVKDKLYPDKTSERYVSDCFCAIGGGGVADTYQKTCACVISGCGLLNAAGVAKYGGDKTPMFCINIGEGCYVK